MFLVEEKKSENGKTSASIYMRADGLFEAHIYRAEAISKEAASFEVCGVTETLKPLQAIVDEELGL